MYTLFVIFIVIAALLMIGIVLIQESKGGGLASGFASANSIGGVRQTTNFIEKATWTLAVTMVVLSIVCAYLAPRNQANSSVMENATVEQTTTNANNVQGFDASQQQAAPAADAQQAAPAEAQQAAPAADAQQAPAAPAEEKK